MTIISITIIYFIIISFIFVQIMIIIIIITIIITVSSPQLKAKSLLWTHHRASGHGARNFASVHVVVVWGGCRLCFKKNSCNIWPWYSMKLYLEWYQQQGKVDGVYILEGRMGPLSWSKFGGHTSAHLPPVTRQSVAQSFSWHLSNKSWRKINKSYIPKIHTLRSPNTPWNQDFTWGCFSSE